MSKRNNKGDNSGVLWTLIIIGSIAWVSIQFSKYGRFQSVQTVDSPQAYQASPSVVTPPSPQERIEPLAGNIPKAEYVIFNQAPEELRIDLRQGSTLRHRLIIPPCTSCQVFVTHPLKCERAGIEMSFNIPIGQYARTTFYPNTTGKTDLISLEENSIYRECWWITREMLKHFNTQ